MAEKDNLFFVILETVMAAFVMPIYVLGVFANMVAGLLFILIGLAPFIAIGFGIFFLLILLL